MTPTPTVPPHVSFGGPQRASEQDEYARPRTSLVPLSVRALAAAILETAWQDLYDTDIRTQRPHWRWEQCEGYLPDPEDARRWFLSERERAERSIPFLFCCAALRLDPSAVRAVCLTRPPRRKVRGA